MREFILLDNNLHEIGPATLNVDFEVGTSEASTNDFKLETNLISKLEFYAIYLPGTELGGILNTDKSTNIIDLHVLNGLSWRGQLTRHIVEPPAGQDYKVVSGDLTTILTSLIADLSPIYYVDSELTGKTVTNYKINRYVNLLDAIDRLLNDNGYRLSIDVVKAASGQPIRIKLKAIEQTVLQGVYNNDLYIPMEYLKDNSGYNHIIAAGRGELKDREIVNLYIDENGEISQTKYYTGIEESTYFYDYSSVESLEELEKEAATKLKELQNKKVLKISSNNTNDKRLINLEIGDVIKCVFPGGDIIDAPVIKKIYTVENGNITTQIKVRGEE